MKRAQKKFHGGTMSQSNVILSKKRKFIIGQNLSLSKNFLAAEFFSLSIRYNNRF